MSVPGESIPLLCRPFRPPSLVVSVALACGPTAGRSDGHVKAAFRNDAYWAKPVPGFGDPNARMLILGLAPAAHGANRTGRVFTGDGVGASGDFLMSALKRADFANISTSQRSRRWSRVAGCVYRRGRPLRAAGQQTVARRRSTVAWCTWPTRSPPLPRLCKVVVALGKIAWDAWLKVCALRGVPIPKPRPAFGHGAIAHLHPATSAPRHPSTLVGAYHPSRQNTNTGVVTAAMYDAVFRKVRAELRG